MSVSFPVVLYMRGALTVEDEASIAVAGIDFPRDGVMIAKASAKKGYEEPPGWLLDFQGYFLEFVPDRRLREWAAPISALVQFVQVQYSLDKPRRITVGELRDRLGGVVDKFPEAPVSADLFDFLQKFSPDVEVTKEVIEAWGV